MNKKPPKIAEWMLSRIANTEERFSVTGDFEEGYNAIRKSDGKVIAFCWYWLQVVISFPPYLSYTIYRSFMMLQSYVKIAFRNLMKQKIYAGINIIGLSLGLSCSILIYLYVADELSFDKFHENKNTIYRVVHRSHNPDGSFKSQSSRVAPPTGPALQNDFPEIESIVRFIKKSGVIRYRDNLFNESILLTDEAIFDVFSFPMKKGRSAGALSDNNAVVLTENYASKYFGTDEPLGKSLSIDFGNGAREYLVTGILKSIPANSSIQFDIALHVNNLKFTKFPNEMDSWDIGHVDAFVKLGEDASLQNTLARMPEFTNKYFADVFYAMKRSRRWSGEGPPFSLSLQNISKIHLDTAVSGGSDPKYSYILGGIALIVLVIACINFINLSIGRSSLRSTEIGVRKVIGAARKQLMVQFYCESFLMTLIAMNLAIVVTYFAIPAFNLLSGKSLAIANIVNVQSMLMLFTLALVVGFISGGYPALIMSNLKLSEIFKRKLKLGSKNYFTKTLVIIQFSLSIFLIISTIIMNRQVQYMIDGNPGFDNEGIVVIHNEGSAEDDQMLKTFKERVTQYANIHNVSAASYSIGEPGLFYSMLGDKRIRMYKVDRDYLDLIGLNIIQGSNFSDQMLADGNAIIVNQKFLDEVGIESPIGVNPWPANLQIGSLRIAGVIENYNYMSFENEIEPLVLHLKSMFGVQGFRTIMVRISSTNISETIKTLGDVWKTVQPDKPFRYSFLEDDFASLYEDEKQWSSIVKYSSIFAVFIASMGIFGLTSITITRRVKEIGVRKVLGATGTQIISLVSKEFLLLVVIANLIAWPAAYRVMGQFLENYYYRIDLAPGYFIIAGSLSVGVAFFTILFLAVRASLNNPADSLRYE